MNNRNNIDRARFQIRRAEVLTQKSFYLSKFAIGFSAIQIMFISLQMWSYRYSNELLKNKGGTSAIILIITDLCIFFLRNKIAYKIFYYILITSFALAVFCLFWVMYAAFNFILVGH